MGKYSRGLFTADRRAAMSGLYGKAPERTFGGEQGKPDPALKGKKGGNCNRTACQAPGAFAWSLNNHAYYCDACAKMLNWEPSNRAYWEGRYGITRFVFRPETLTEEEIAKLKAGRAYVPGVVE